MLHFNQLLAAANLDPAGVRLVRHAPDRKRHRQIFDSALRGADEFRIYQETQGDPHIVAQFRAANHLAGFVVEPGTKRTVFMGVWDQLGGRSPTIEAFESPPNEANVVFRTQPRGEFDEYRGRLVIDWGKSERAWVQRADRRAKPIIELRQHATTPAFPGFAKFRSSLDLIDSLPLSWSEVLRNAGGVYLLVHRPTSRRYVGSASGDGGFFARWSSYADGHGGNVALRELAARPEDYDVAVLDSMGSSSDPDEVCARELVWKEKLGTRSVEDLNRN